MNIKSLTSPFNLAQNLHGRFDILLYRTVDCPPERAELVRVHDRFGRLAESAAFHGVRNLIHYLRLPRGGDQLCQLVQMDIEATVRRVVRFSVGPALQNLQQCANRIRRV